MTFFDILVVTQYAITTLSSAFNTCYFAGYRSPEKRRRIGAAVLTVVTLAMFIESLYLGAFFLQGHQWQDSFFLDSRYWLMARLFACLGSVLISILVLRYLVRKKI